MTSVLRILLSATSDDYLVAPPQFVIRINLQSFRSLLVNEIDECNVLSCDRLIRSGKGLNEWLNNLRILFSVLRTIRILQSEVSLSRPRYAAQRSYYIGFVTDGNLNPMERSARPGVLSGGGLFFEKCPRTKR
jgi:hypothetical protein